MESQDTEQAKADVSEGSEAEKRLEAKLNSMTEAPKETEIVTPETSGVADLPPPKPSKAEQSGGARGDVSASAVARMMGLATASEVSLLEGKIDLLSSRMSNILVK